MVDAYPPEIKKRKSRTVVISAQDQGRDRRVVQLSRHYRAG
jgi:hypothetical protein